VKDIRSNPPADLFEEILELQEDLEVFRHLAPKGPSSDLEALRIKLQDEREHLEKRQAEMEASLQNKFKEWDQLQGCAPLPSQAREEKNTILRDMQEILSNRTYVRNMVNDLLETTG
jgi:molecular chaperone HscB